MGEIRTVKGRERERATAAERAVQPRRDGNCSENQCRPDSLTTSALGSYGYLRMAPPNRRLHEEGHQAASCEAHRQKEHWRDRASGRIANPRYDALRDEAAKVATELIAASPAAAEAPVKNFDGRLHQPPAQHNRRNRAYRRETRDQPVLRQGIHRSAEGGRAFRDGERRSHCSRRPCAGPGGGALG
jgi:hypothetical protein